MIYRAVMADELLPRAVAWVDTAARAWVELEHRHVSLPELAGAHAWQVQEESAAANVVERGHGVVVPREVPGEAVEQCEGYDFLRGSRKF